MAKFCYNCGNELVENAYICTKCGVVVSQDKSNNNDSGSIGYGILGFFFPLVGFILYLCWKKDCPKNAKIAGKGALISVIINIVLCILAFVFSFVFYTYTSNTIDNDFDYDYDYDYNLKFD